MPNCVLAQILGQARPDQQFLCFRDVPLPHFLEEIIAVKGCRWPAFLARDQGGPERFEPRFMLFEQAQAGPHDHTGGTPY